MFRLVVTFQVTFFVDRNRIVTDKTYVSHHAKLRLFSEIFMSGFIADSDRAESGGVGGNDASIMCQLKILAKL